MLEVRHVFKVGVCGWGGRSDAGEDLLPELGDDIRIRGEFVEEPGERHGDGVTPCEQYGNDLVPDYFAVARE